MMKYYYFQVTTDETGKVTPAVYVRETEQSAMKTFYQRCAVDVDAKADSLDMVIDEEGHVVACKTFNNLNNDTPDKSDA